jgi:hypothetical protein
VISGQYDEDMNLREKKSSLSRSSRFMKITDIMMMVDVVMLEDTKQGDMKERNIMEMAW